MVCTIHWLYAESELALYNEQIQFSYKWCTFTVFSHNFIAGIARRATVLYMYVLATCENSNNCVQIPRSRAQSQPWALHLIWILWFNNVRTAVFSLSHYQWFTTPSCYVLCAWQSYFNLFWCSGLLQNKTIARWGAGSMFVSYEQHHSSTCPTRGKKWQGETF